MRRAGSNAGTTPIRLDEIEGPGYASDSQEHIYDRRDYPN